MTEYGDMIKNIVIRNVGEARFEEICRQFHLSQNERKLMDRLWSEWKPDYSLDDMVALAEKYRLSGYGSSDAGVGADCQRSGPH